jgi:mRNA interferase RelE/StbE
MSGLFKLRIGDWRVIYTVEKDTVVIRAVGHRKEIYSK